TSAAAVAGGRLAADLAQSGYTVDLLRYDDKTWVGAGVADRAAAASELAALCSAVRRCDVAWIHFEEVRVAGCAGDALARILRLAAATRFAIVDFHDVPRADGLTLGRALERMFHWRRDVLRRPISSYIRGRAVRAGYAGLRRLSRRGRALVIC